ncbi:hypothetical protein WCE55_04135 [Luteimonas sp. MJ293]|uniref:hypothetical protein n=1 Tax=Luteimonas sp. MJ146 TaxID=3129240 RepID=UPI0031B9FB0B
MALCVGLLACATLPERVVDAHDITQAHAVTNLTALRLSYVGSNSFVLGEGRESPVFFRQPITTAERDASLVRVFPSARLTDAGFDTDAGNRLAEYILRVQHASLPEYLGQNIPVRRIDIHLLHGSERLVQRGHSFSASRRHRLRFAFRFNPAEEDRSMRSIVRTLSHELLHVARAVEGRRRRSIHEEEQAAYTVEHCVELDLFGDTAAPRRSVLIRDQLGEDLASSLSAGHTSDPARAAVFDGRPVLTPAEADGLRALCQHRAATLFKRHAR